MIPRARIDIGYADILAGTAALIGSPQSPPVNWPADGHVIACLSARTAFDLYLRALALPQGSEVLLSAVTIRDMARIIRAHGLVPVPLDVPADTLAPTAEALLRLRTDRSRVLLLAHLFGAESNFAPLLHAAHEHGMLVVEDCAQAAGAGQFAGNPASDLRLFSFGPIKTETALGGGLAVLRDASVAERMRAIHAHDPVQPRAAFARRLARYTLLHTLERPALYGAFVTACRLAGRSHDNVIAASTRGFPGPQLLPLIRRRASAAQLALLARRIAQPSVARLQERMARARQLDALLSAGVRRPGRATLRPTHWLFPVLVPQPEVLMRELWGAGIDATRGSTSLSLIEASAERPDAVTPLAAAWMADVLFLPAYASISERMLARIADRVNEYVARTERVPQHA